MQVRCVKPFAAYQVGDVTEVPDGAEVSGVYFEPLGGTPPPPGGTPPPGDHDDPPADSAAGAFSPPRSN